MKKIFVLGFAAIAITLSLIFINTGETASGLCFLCGSGSSCEQCVSPSGKDTQNDRKYCEQKGCKISGYTSCSGAANVKYCR